MRARERERGAGVPARAGRRERAARQLDHECRVASEGAVLPRDRRAVVVREVPAREAAARRVEALELRVARALHDHPQRLVVPERHARALALDEALHDLRLGLGRRAGARLVDAVLVLPAVREVAVEIDAVGVVARARRGAVGVRVRHEPERGAARRARAAEPLDHRPARLLVAVDGAHHEQLHARAWAAHAQRADRAILLRPPDRLPARRLGRGGRCRGRRGRDACEEAREQHSHEYAQAVSR